MATHREGLRQCKAPEQTHLHSWDSGGICDSYQWLVFVVKTFRAAIKIDINDIFEEFMWPSIILH